LPQKELLMDQYFNFSLLFYLMVAAYISFIHPQIFKKTFSPFLKGIVMTLLLIISLIYLSENTYNPFIYFRF